jgi:hypothetical protein
MIFITSGNRSLGHNASKDKSRGAFFDIQVGSDDIPLGPVLTDHTIYSREDRFNGCHVGQSIDLS